MPRRHQDTKSDCCCWLTLLFAYACYAVPSIWLPACTWFFNSYIIISFSTLLIVHYYQKSVLDMFDRSLYHQIVLMGILYPILLITTIVGYVEYFTADPLRCRRKYAGEMIYLLLMLFSSSYSLVYSIMLVCFVIPMWVKMCRDRQRRAQFRRQMDQLQGLDDEPNEEQLNQALLNENRQLDAEDIEYLVNHLR